jgi:hypothetical protein|tara:strand:- start:180 stop:473 length:294 start_codon:yes stop_codon:yes gene_type:complete
MEDQIQKIKREMIQEYPTHSKSYILNILETLIKQQMFWRAFAYSGWNILKTVDIKQEVYKMIQKDINFIKKKILVIKYCYLHNYPVDILSGIQTSLF